jgi:hypothetical protein
MRDRGLSKRHIAIALVLSYSTVKSFFQSYGRFDTISPRRGRPQKILPPPSVTAAIDGLKAARRLTIRDQVSGMPEITRTGMFDLRHSQHYHFYKEVPIPDLKPEHFVRRKEFCEGFLASGEQRPIVFSDESAIEQDLALGGIWRMKGEIVPEMFIPTDQHPLKVMGWGAIGPGGWRSKLVRCPPSVNTVSYLEMLSEAGIFRKLNKKWGEFGYIFMEDNAPAHTGAFSIISGLCAMFTWPAKSPDLNPIEQIWSYLKKKLKGRRFVDEDDLFAAIQAEWNAMDYDMVANFVSSFNARCTVCARLDGRCLNRHWGEVHREHHPQEEVAEAEQGENVV